MEANCESLSESEKMDLAQRKQFLTDFESSKLKSPADLPDLSTTPIVLSWDFNEDETGKHWTIIKHAGQIIWSEPAVWEGAGRFVEVASILKQKYGQGLVDVVPSDASNLYLYGDQLSSISMVERTRASLCPEGPKP
jgi:hypothetical protein